MKSFLIKLYKEKKLQIVEPSEEICESYIEKSESNLVSSKILYDKNCLEEAVALTYYSMYNLLLSLLFKVGIKSENHSGSIILLKEVFELDNSLISEAKKERIDKQYYTDFEITKQEVSGGIISAEDFSRELKGFIFGLNNSDIDSFRGKLKEILKI